ncbi:chemotaxis protein CheB [Lysobacter sp. D1-1-M9]|uniref:chemotaxis protein CheB n=1 Tax=Novilysobacter longmucuonensis TaxID=3098603 RepID=UPI002FC77C9F
MNNEPRRVALLARPGPASDRLGEALAAAGVIRVLHADPTQLDTPELLAAEPQVVLVALDAATEDVLERFDAVLGDPAIDVIYEEADLAAARDGWDAARWMRHLVAKLQGHADVLPPGAGPAPESARREADAAAPASPTGALATDAADGGGSDFDQTEPASFDADAAPNGTAATDFSAFDPLNAEASDYEFQDFDVAISQADGEGAAPDPATEEVEFDAAFNPMLAEATAQAFPNEATAADGDNLEAELAAALEAQDAVALGAFDSRLSLEVESPDAPASREAPSPQFQRDLTDLERRISSLELVDDTPANGPEQPRDAVLACGAVLVMAGIGGPDAVRQLLGALPAGFSRPVLVRQRLDGGRYDKLVAQMQRATSLPVELAESGLPALAGTVYIMPPELGVSASADGLHFSDDGDVLSNLVDGDSAIVLLSGSDPADVEAVMNHGSAGALVAGQSPDGCYDAAAPTELAARGGDTGQPAELAQRLTQRWPA